MTVQDISKTECTGCGACENCCPVNCISLQMDAEGFRYPVIDTSRCINCGNCGTTCLSRRKAGEGSQENVKAYAAYAKDNEVLEYSSSGGIFAVMAKDILDGGGIVYGAKLEELRVKHTRVCDKEHLVEIQKSKYLQSDISLTYRQAKSDLEEGTKILFSGTPCQIAGLYAFLQKEYDNLITCDVVCHGVPSEKVFDKFIRYEEKKHHSKIVDMYWRDKRNGWHLNSIVEVFKNGTETAIQSYQHPFQRGFLDNLYLRPSCYQCRFCGIPRVADISLADYWQANRHNAEFAADNADRGISIVILSRDKGISLFEKVKEKCIWKELDVSVVKECSRHSFLPPLGNKDRENFFAALSTYSFRKLMKKYIFAGEKKIAFSLRCKKFLKQKLSRIYRKM